MTFTQWAAIIIGLACLFTAAAALVLLVFMGVGWLVSVFVTGRRLDRRGGGR